MNIKVSVIVPIYNVEKYLAECLESLVNQSLKQIEIICINDGSTDSSAWILEEYNKKYSQIKVINKDNTGYGDSVNIGISNAKGEYIGIVEPDDYIEKDAFEKLYNLGAANSSDIVRGNFYYYSKQKNEKRDSIKKDIIVSNLKKESWLFMEPPAIWSAIYKRAFIVDNNITLLETPGASFQDTGFYFKTLVSANKIYLTKDAFLHYRIDNSSSSVKSNKKVYNVVEEHKSIRDFMISKKLFDKYYENIVVAKFANYIWNTSRLSKKEAKKFITYIKEELMVNKKEGKIDRTLFSAKHWFLLKTLFVSEKLFYIATRLNKN